MILHFEIQEEMNSVNTKLMIRAFEQFIDYMYESVCRMETGLMETIRGFHSADSYCMLFALRNRFETTKTDNKALWIQ